MKYAPFEGQPDHVMIHVLVVHSLGGCEVLVAARKNLRMHLTKQFGNPIGDMAMYPDAQGMNLISDRPIVPSFRKCESIPDGEIMITVGPCPGGSRHFHMTICHNPKEPQPALTEIDCLQSGSGFPGVPVRIAVGSLDDFFEIFFGRGRRGQ